VSNPAWFVTNGYSRIVRQMEIVRELLALRVSTKRGMPSELLATLPADAMDAPGYSS
jgi:hypothetical protein